VATGTATATLVRKFARALEEFADELLAETPEEVLSDADDNEITERQLGPRQREIVDVLHDANAHGLKTAEIADRISYDGPNTYSTLMSLARRRVVELIPGSDPQSWRLAPRFRNAEPYMRAAALVHEGEWTTYGDLSIVVRGDTNGARAAGRAAARLPQFPNPHRVLGAGGVIPPGWRDEEGHGPKECRRRLDREGVRFLDDGRADPAFRVAHETLKERYDQRSV
jgi:alkylated DNA nucleotide flippase Atl1